MDPENIGPRGTNDINYLSGAHINSLGKAYKSACYV